jgi:hypothetical protein
MERGSRGRGRGKTITLFTGYEIVDVRFGVEMK